MKFKKVISVFVALILLFSSFSILEIDNGMMIKADAAGLSLTELKAKFPEGKYWNHYCSSTTDTSNYCKDQGINCYPDTVSSSPCWSHSASGYSSYVGKYDCNRYSGATQCCGFAKRISYLAYGSNCTAWSKGSLSSLKPGDVIHYYGDGAGSDWGHWVTVVAVNGSAITVGECNWGAKCLIKWSRVIYTYNLSSTTVYSAPYALTTGSTPSVSLTTDSRYSVPFKCRIISTTKVQCYNDAAKTSSPGYIYPDDDCVVTAIYTNGLLKCECPWSDGSTKTVYIDKSAFINSSMTPSSMTAPQYSTTYLRSDGGTSIGWIDPGDSITKVAVSGGYTQIIYPASVGKRCAWVPTSVLSSPDVVSYPTPFICRIRATEKVPCYNDVNFSSSPGNIYVDDECRITAIYTNGKVQCKCPWSDGSTKTVYVNSSVFFASTPTPVKMSAPKYALTYLRSTDTSASWGWIDVGDNIYKLGTSGNMTQIIYPTSSGEYRCAWAYTSDLTQTYTVSYNANGGTGAPGSQTKTYNVSLSLSSTVPLRTGYTFVGWSTSSSATSAQYAAGGAYNANSSVTLYAVWRANQYNISYNANGGIGAPSPQTKTHGSALTLSSTKPTWEGHSFLGWSTSSTATTATYTAGGSYTSNSAATLYAVWKTNTYTVSYDANGGTGAPASQTKTYDVLLKLSTSIPSKDGYSFVGWTSISGGTAVEYNPGDYFSYDSNTTLYAIWEKIPATLSSIEVSNTPKTEFNVGDTFTSDGLALTAHYSDDTTKTINSGYTVSAPNMSTPGTKTVTVSFEGKTTTYSINVKSALNAMLTVENKSVAVGEEFEVKVNISANPGFCYLKLRPSYDSSKFEFIEAVNGVVSTDTFSSTTDAMLWDSDKNATENGVLVTLKFKAKETLTSGTYSVGVTVVEGYNYDEVDINFSTTNATVTVTEKVTPVIESIEVSSMPTKTTYEIGEAFISAGLSIVATYSDGTTKSVTSGFDVSGFSSATAGAKTIKVTYQGKSTTFNVTVKAKEIDPNAAQIIVGGKTAVVGKTVDIDISLKNNPGIVSMSLKVDYDSSVMKLVNVADAGVLGTQVHKPSYSSPYYLIWANDTATENFTFNGNIVRLTFEISETATPGEYPITVSYDKDNYDIYNCDVECVDFSVICGNVKVIDVLIGDVNGDGLINNLDRLMLTRYLAMWDGYTEENVNITAADVNCDGKVNNLDRLILTRYLAKWDGYETLPYQA